MILRLDHYELLKANKLNPPEWMNAFRCTIPPQKKGRWEIRNFTVELDMMNLRHMRDGRGCFPGKYTQLMHKKRGIIMSDTTAEINDLYRLYKMATGRVLIHGLGLGCAVKGALSKQSVTRVDVVEIDKDIIAMVSPYLVDDRLHIHCGDAFDFKWSRESYWDVSWHDIWDGICEDNIPSMKRLIKKFARRCDWQSCWAMGWCEQ
jgi:hypothetical protein